MYKAEADGITHINVGTKVKTELGKALSNFSSYPTKIEYEGEELIFQSLEGFWFFYISYKHDKEKRYDYLNLKGFEANSLGRTFVKDNNVDIDLITSRKAFKENFCNAIKAKLKQNKMLLSMLTYSELPLTSYYTNHNKELKENEYKWQIELLEEARDLMHKKLKLYKYKEN